MAGPQHLQVGVSGELVSYPPMPVHADAVTIRYRTPASPMQDDAVPAVVDPLNAEVASPAKAGADVLELREPPAIVARRSYIVVLPSGLRVVVIARGAEDSKLHLTEPLPVAVPEGSEVLGYAVSVPLSAGELERAGEGVAIWSVTADGFTSSWAQQLRVVRRQVAYTLTAPRLTSQSKLAARLRSPTDDGFDEVIEAAWNRYVLPALHAKQLLPERIISWELLEPVHIAAVELLLLPESDVQARDLAREELARVTATVLAGAELWYDAAEAENPRRVEGAAVSSFTRLRR